MQPSSGVLTRTLLFALLFSAACTPQATPTLFVPPTAAVIIVASAVPADAPSATPRPAAATAVPVTSTPTPCTNDLLFVQDLTVPDGTTLLPGATIDKQWLVTNAGTCNWDAGYRLKLISGDALGAATEQVLYPARAGTQATLRIMLTAPGEAGSYQGAWQAYGPDGAAFGEPVYVQVIVSP